MDSEHEHILRSLIGEELSKLATVGEKLYPIEHPIASQREELCVVIDGEDVCGLRIVESKAELNILLEYACSKECTEKISRFGKLEMSLSDPNLAKRLKSLINNVVEYQKKNIPQVNS